MFQRLITGIAVLVVSGCQPDSQTGSAISSEEATEAVQHLLAVQDRMANAGDLEGFMRLIGEDAVFLPPGEPSLNGIAEIRAWYEGLFANFDIALEHIPGPVEVAGSLIIHRGVARGRLTPRAGGDPITFDNKYLFVLRVRTDGSLEHWRAMFNANPAEM